MLLWLTFFVAARCRAKSLAEHLTSFPLKLDCPWRPPRCRTFKPSRHFDILCSRIVRRTNSFHHARPAGGVDFSPKMWWECRYQSASGWLTQRVEPIISLGSVARLPAAGAPDHFSSVSRMLRVKPWVAQSALWEWKQGSSAVKSES